MPFLSHLIISCPAAIKLLITAVIAVMLVACQPSQSGTAQQHAPEHEPVTFVQLAVTQKVEAAQWFKQRTFPASNALANAELIIATKKEGVLVLNAKGETLSALNGYFTTVDHRTSEQGLLVATVDGNLQQAVVSSLNASSGVWAKPLILPKPRFKIEDACLYQDQANNSFVFLLGEEGLGEQWLVAAEAALLPKALLVRSLSLPPASGFCQVDDATHTLYVNEENVGLWAYAADAEAELSRKPLTMLQPFSDIAGQLSSMAVSNKEVLVLDAERKKIYRHYPSRSSSDKTYKALSTLDVSMLQQPEKINVRESNTALEILVQDNKELYVTTISAQDAALAPADKKPVSKVATVKALVATDAIPSLGDAADDPAIWLHPTDASRSLILGTDKQGGLAAYNLQGREQQYLPVGRLNNVDIRTGFSLNGRLIDLAVASNRDHNSLHLFSIDRQSGRLTALGEQPTTLEDIYGICMFKDKQNQFYALVNDKDGSFEQYRLTVADQHIVANKVRDFKVATQPEGCVADDASEQLFVGEENEAVWALSAAADAPTTMTKVIATKGVVHADIEGIAYYRGKNQHYLIISSQGNDSYVVVEANAPYKLRGVFKIGINAALAIDGVSETDGLEVTSADLSGNNSGPWRRGMLVVQDGRKRMPEGRQNFKYVPWTAIAEALKLE